MTQPAITVKIPEELKRNMDKIDINWSQYVRDCLQKKVDYEKRKAAFEKLDEIRKRSKPVSTEEIVQWIREDREER